MDNLSNPQRRQAPPAASDSQMEAVGAGHRLMRFAGDFFRVTKGERSEQVAGYLTIMPALFLIMGLTLYPVIYSIWLSLLDKHSFFPQERFIGLENYIYLWSDPEFWSSFWLGLVYSFWTIVFQIILGVAAALILNETFIGRNLIRGMVLFPYMIPTIVAVILWKWLLNDMYGVVNYWLLAIGIVEEPISWLGADHIMFSVVVMSIWQFFPFVLLTILARLQTIPEKLTRPPRWTGPRPSSASSTSPSRRSAGSFSWSSCCAASGCSRNSIQYG